MSEFLRSFWSGLMPLLVVAAYGLPAQCIPQWIDLGSSVNDVLILLDYNSLKRDGQRVGFATTIIPKDQSSNYAFFQWVDCQRWAYLFEGESDWKLIAARTMIDTTAKYVCSKSKPSLTVNSPASSGDDLAKVGTDGICTFLSREGSDVVANPCKITSTPGGTTLLWSDGVSTQMRFEGDKVFVQSPDIGDLQGTFLSRTPKRMAIQYQGGLSAGAGVQIALSLVDSVHG